MIKKIFTNLYKKEIQKKVTKEKGFIQHQVFSKKKIGAGFTLIEVMVSVLLFVIITTIGISSVINANNTNKKTQAMRSAIDNLSYVIEDMSRNIRLGSNYLCSGSTCPPAPNNPVFPLLVFTGVDGQTIGYQFLANGVVEKSIGGLNSFIPITSPEIKIDAVKSGFYIYTGYGIQPRVLIRLSGQIQTTGGIMTNFDLQTTVTQRSLNFPI
ncbi:MAG: prepilin-type N-terminal cleavage/methylation domain-containing protein [Candidatus Paceibacterota bacterium]|jgi:prepilin-type N-terminal cleavage/methylation domain-containing protein